MRAACTTTQTHFDGQSTPAAATATASEAETQKQWLEVHGLGPLSDDERERIFGDQCSTVTECNIDTGLAFAAALRPDVVRAHNQRVFLHAVERRQKHKPAEVAAVVGAEEHTNDLEDEHWKVLETPPSHHGNSAVTAAAPMVAKFESTLALQNAKAAAEDGGYCCINYAPKRQVAVVRDMAVPPTLSEVRRRKAVCFCRATSSQSKMMSLKLSWVLLLRLKLDC